jgi:SAM-dependent methyltransferase
MSDPRRIPRRGRGARGSKPGGSAVGWDAVAEWYDRLVGESGSDYHRKVILPAAMRLLAIQAGESVLDLCCGQGVMAAPVLEAGAARFVGVDASTLLIRRAHERHGVRKGLSFLIADASVAGTWTDASHDAVSCIMAVHDVADLDGLCRSAFLALKPGGRAVFVLMHPCFRIPQHAHWGWDPDRGVQYRRVDAYRSPLDIQVTTHPGKKDGAVTIFHHRPLADLLNALGRAGLSVQACEELLSHRRSQGGGPFSKAEHRAAAEFPLFLALKAVRPPVPDSGALVLGAD